VQLIQKIYNPNADQFSKGLLCLENSFEEKQAQIDYNFCQRFTKFRFCGVSLPIPAKIFNKPVFLPDYNSPIMKKSPIMKEQKIPRKMLQHEVTNERSYAKL